jgi:aspartyl-tRNA(Asn)/glutamyl-tRNA(Gln) amidotransferase subunit B
MSVEFEAVIGLEVHIRLKDDFRVFCPTPASEDSLAHQPRLEATCLGLPGTLPVLDERALLAGLTLGIALHCKPAETVRFERKHYLYPDLPKGYQISQKHTALCGQGKLEIVIGKARRSIGISHIHVEEDTARIAKSKSSASHEIDYSRSGLALLEVVTQPDMRNPDEAVLFLQRIRQVVRYLNISDAQMEAGQMRCDANISLRERGELKFGTRTEIKNVNSFHFLKLALEYEITRQFALIRDGKVVERETRGFDEISEATYPMRPKEFSQQYLFMNEPDLPCIRIPPSTIEVLRTKMLRLPESFETELTERFGLEEHEVQILCAEPEYVTYFLNLVAGGVEARLAYHWLTSELFGMVSRRKMNFADLPVSAERFTELLLMLQSGVINGKIAKYILQQMMPSVTISAKEIAEAESLYIIREPAVLDELIRNAFSSYPSQLEELLAGKHQLASFFIGRIMLSSQGRAEPEVLKVRIGELVESMKNARG